MANHLEHQRPNACMHVLSENANGNKNNKNNNNYYQNNNRENIFQSSSEE